MLSRWPRLASTVWTHALSLSLVGADYDYSFHPNFLPSSTSLLVVYFFGEFLRVILLPLLSAAGGCGPPRDATCEFERFLLHHVYLLAPLPISRLSPHLCHKLVVLWWGALLSPPFIMSYMLLPVPDPVPSFSSLGPPSWLSSRCMVTQMPGLATGPACWLSSSATPV